jgi:hypothetical protein
VIDAAGTRKTDIAPTPAFFAPGLLASAFLALAVLSCADKTPVKITYASMPAAILDTKVHDLTAAVVNQKGEAIEGQAVTYAVTPEGVAELRPDGRLQCLKTGDATVTLSGGGLSAPVPVKCRLPTEIAMPPAQRLLLGGTPLAIHPRVLGEGGRPLDDVLAPIGSSDPAVAAVVGDKIKPVAVGRAKVQAIAGEIVAVTPIEVDEKVVSGTVTLADGAARTWTLKQGDYVVTIDMKPDVRSSQGVTVSWAGANCDSQPEKPSHHLECKVIDSATLTVTNPKQIGVGSRMTGSIEVLRVPPA